MGGSGSIRSGFTRLVLGLAASVTNLTHGFIEQSLQSVKTRGLLAWIEEHLGTSIQSQRRRALGFIGGTKTG